MNPDMERLVKVAQRVAAEHLARGEQPSTEAVIMAVLEEMKTPSERVQEAMLTGMQAAKAGLLTERDIAITSLGYFSILGAYRGTMEDEDE